MFRYVRGAAWLLAALVGLLLRTGLMSPRHRDLRKLRRFHDFRRVEAKLLRFYPEKE